MKTKLQRTLSAFCDCRPVKYSGKYSKYFVLTTSHCFFCSYIICVLNFVCISHITGTRQKEPGNPVLGYCVPKNTFPNSECIACVVADFTLRYTSLQERGNEDIIYFIFLSGNWTHSLSRLCYSLDWRIYILIRVDFLRKFH